jgi:hypothetical protein
MKKNYFLFLFVLALVFLYNTSYSQIFWQGAKLLTQGAVDRNPSFGMKSRVVNPYNPYEYLVFERSTMINTANICAIKMRSNGNYDSVFYVTSGVNLCRNPSVDYYSYYSGGLITALVVWEQYVAGRWNLYARNNLSTTGWGSIFAVDTTSSDKSNPSVARLFADSLYGVAYVRNNDIIYREFNIYTGAQIFELNLTLSDTSECRKPNLSVNNRVGMYNKFVAYERKKSNGQYAIYSRYGNYANVWNPADTVSLIGNNRNPKFTCGYSSNYLSFESDRNGKWNIYIANINTAVSSIESIYQNTSYNCRSFSSFFYPVITDFTAYAASFVRQGNDSIKILSGQGYGIFMLRDSITIGDTNCKPSLTINNGIGVNSGRGYSTIYMVYNKDSLGYSKLYAKYFVILLDNLRKLSGDIPYGYSLGQNYPNPFNQSSIISFQCPVQGMVKLKVYDIRGCEVTTLVNEKLNAGSYEVVWNASQYASGVYFYRLSSENFIETKKLLLIK